MSALLRISLGAAALAFVTSALPVLVEQFLPGGHPPLSMYVAVIALPLAWVLALVGIVAALALRRSGPESRSDLALVCSISALACGLGVWFFWSSIANAL